MNKKKEKKNTRDVANFHLQPDVTEGLVDRVTLPLLHLEHIRNQLDGCKGQKERGSRQKVQLTCGNETDHPRRFPSTG